MNNEEEALVEFVAKDAIERFQEKQFKSYERIANALKANKTIVVSLVTPLKDPIYPHILFPE